ncbi:MAG TPA: 4-hydroxy-tetrahydrodipicolinate synthase [Solirubrobacterales bacterium]|jgi:4-hydroxy-tetrahydrodipicolinate synthase|nr:4-hydroxy-tetrahydrodipicolinate synthase [Solirubrobacterales bacterium]
MAAEIGGVLTAMVTPFAEDGSVDEAAARRLAGHLVGNGSHGVVVAGTTGESPTLSDQEVISLLSAVKAEVGDTATVVCGTGTNDTRHSERLSAAAAEAGADAVLVVAPYYNKPNRAGIGAHYEAVAGAAGVPVIVYNIPSRVVINLPPDLLAELGQVENIVAVKQANNDEIGEVAGLDVLAGNDDVFLRCLENGGVGGILVASHAVGNEMRQVLDAFDAGELDRARQVDQRIRPVYEAMGLDTNPIPVKAAAEMLGLIPSARMRLPMVAADESTRAGVRSALEAQGLLTASAA